MSKAQQIATKAQRHEGDTKFYWWFLVSWCPGGVFHLLPLAIGLRM